MKHEIEITRVIALLDEVLLVIFEDKTLHVHDVELIRNRLPDIQPFSEPETVQAVDSGEDLGMKTVEEVIEMVHIEAAEPFKKGGMSYSFA